jgi:hypothetical protein
VGAIEAEILREKAEALGRAGERLEQALRDVDAACRALAKIDAQPVDAWDSAGSGAAPQDVRAALVARLGGLRRRARLAYDYLIIQREAVGIRGHVDVERCYRIAERLG